MSAHRWGMPTSNGRKQAAVANRTGDIDVMRVFFYGLFMDESLLETKGIKPVTVGTGFVDGYELRIGERATLIRVDSGRAYGVMMEIEAGEAAELYAEDSVADYVTESVMVKLMGGEKVEARCYNLPLDKVTGTNKKYAVSLLELATQLGFLESYLGQITQSGE